MERLIIIDDQTQLPQNFFFGKHFRVSIGLGFLLVFYFGSHTKNTKGTTKFSQYDVTIIIINEL